jgi:hypothetical protein
VQHAEEHASEQNEEAMAIEAGKQNPDDVYPYYRWVPPVPFADYTTLSLPPWGTFAETGPAYQSPPQSNCPDCMNGLGLSCDSPLELAADRMKWFFLGGTLGVLIGLVAVPVARELSRR